MPLELAYILAAVGLLLAVIGCYLFYKSNQAHADFKLAERQLEEERAELESRAALAESEAARSKRSAAAATPKRDGATAQSLGQEEGLRKQLKTQRDKLKKQKQKTQSIARERDALTKQLSDLKSVAKQPAARHDEALLQMRLELGEAKQELERYRARLEDGGGAHEEDFPWRAAAPRERAEPEPIAERYEGSGDQGGNDDAAYIGELKQRVASLEAQLREQEGALRNQLKKQGRDIDRQRRRADNNDKAYRITQRELDAARERVRMLQEQVGRAHFTASSASAAAASEAHVEANALGVVGDEQANKPKPPSEPEVNAPVEEAVEEPIEEPRQAEEEDQLDEHKTPARAVDAFAVDDAWGDLDLDEEI